MTAPVNDNYADATLISGTTGTIVGTALEATSESRDNRPMVWFKWVVPETGVLTVDTLQTPTPSDLGGQLRTEIAIYVGDDYDTAFWKGYVTDLDRVHGNWLSRGYANLWEVGQEVHIGVYCMGFSPTFDAAAMQDFTLHWSFEAKAVAAPPPLPTTPPPNDLLENAIVITGTSGTISGSTYLNSGMDSDGDFPPSNAPDNTKDYACVWYKWSSPFNGYMRFRATQPQGGWLQQIIVLRKPNMRDPFMEPVEYTRAKQGEWQDNKYIVTADTNYWIGVAVDGGFYADFYNFDLTWTAQLSLPDGNGVTTMPLTDEFTPAATLTYIPEMGEIWVNHDHPEYSSPPTVIGRFKESTGELLGYIQFSPGIADELYYDKLRGRVWAGVFPSSPNQITSWDIVTRQNMGVVTLPAGTHYDVGNAFNPVDGMLWMGGIYNGDPQHFKYKKVDPVTGTLLGTYLENSTNKISDTFFTTTGDHWILYGGTDGYTYDSLAHFNETTGTIDASFSFNDDPAFRLKRVVYDEDRQVFWALTTNAWADIPEASFQDKLVEFTISTRTVANTYDIPYTFQGPFINYVAYDTYRKQVLVIDAQPVLTGEQQTDAQLLAFDTVTGQQVYSAPLVSSGWMVTAPTAPWIMGYNAFYRIAPPPPIVNIDIINDRDVWLQSFTYEQRFEKVTVQPGNTSNINQDQLTGITLTGAKKLSLTAAAQVFRVSGTIIEPLSITITPTLRNLTGTPSYSVIAGSATLTIVGDKVNVAYGAMSSNSVTIKATLGGFEDQVTLVKTISGSTAIQAFLTNESETIICDSVGNIMSYIGASGDFRVFEGTLEVSSECTFSVANNPDNILMVIDNKGHYSVQGIPTTVDATTVTLQAIYKNQPYDRVFKIFKSKAAAGSSADPSIRIGPDGKRLPIELTVPILGLSWNDQIANDAMIPYGGPGLNDIITEYNAVSNFRETRFFNRVEWLTMEARIDGNLLVKGSVGVEALSAESVDAITGTFEQLITDALDAHVITADQIDVTTLRINGTNIDPNSVATGHVVDNAINVPLLTDGFPGANIGADYSSATLTGTYPGAAVALVSVTIQGSGGISGSVAEIQILLDGVQQQARAFNLSNTSIVGNTLQVQIAVPAGSHSWVVRFHRQGSNDWTLWSYSVSVLGVMK